MPQFAAVELMDLLPVIQQWHAAAPPTIATKNFEATFCDFGCAWTGVKYAIGEGPLKEIFMQAMAKPLPKTAEKYSKVDSLRRMVLLCRELQHHAGEEPFYLACRSAGDVLGLLT